MSSSDLSINEEAIEKVYQKKTQLEHILLRPDSYVGSIKNEEKTMWIYDFTKECMVEKRFFYNPGLYKIFDEILVNASDNKIRDKKMSSIRIDIDAEKNMIRVWNNGKGIPVVMHKDTKSYVPSMIFGQLLTSSNFNDDKKQVTGGRNGYGAKLCNIFSNEFTVETSSKEYGKSFKQTWRGNMGSFSDPIIENSSKEDFTCITFYPDLAKFGMTHLDENIIALFGRRAFDIAACTNGISVHLNGKIVPVKNFKDYVELYTKGFVDEDLKIVYEKIGDRWEIAMTTSVNDSFTQVSFVNSIATTKGGTHVNYVTDQAASKLLEIAKKKVKNDKQAVKLKPAQVKMNMWVFVRCLIENPSFDSQTKENMTLQSKDFGSVCTLSDKFLGQMSKTGIIEKITAWADFKNQAFLDKKCSKTKQLKLKDIPKLDDAVLAGTKNSLKCRLFLTEGDSAKALAVSGLSVVGRDNFGVFPLRGKLLNVRDASTAQLSQNTEISNLIKILGLQYQQKYEHEDSLKSLRYGKLVLMTDQDQDGSHIKGLVINFIHAKWPNLLRHNFMEEFITPIVKATRNDKKESLSFYSIPEFLEWEKNTPDHHKWNKKYYKGLGTSTSTEAKEYFTDMDRHLIRFRYSGEADDKSIVMAFSKDKTDDRKDWLTQNMEEVRRRRELGLGDLFLYGKGTKTITYDEFINKELVLFSNTDNVRSIPSMVDGFKPGQRKVLYACFRRNLIRELKVAQLAGSVAELSAYHHGEASLMGTIINLAQDFVGSNNINLLLPNGQFGTRLVGGKDNASSRYIFTQLSKITRLIFHPDDDPLLRVQYEDNQRIEPEWYCPIIPMVLVNGCDGIGTGWSSKIPNFNPKDVIDNIRRLLRGEAPRKLHPWYRGFRGSIIEICDNKYQVSGEIATLGENCIEITELPIRTWSTPYKEGVMEVFQNGSDKTPAVITDYRDYNTDTTVRFVVDMAPARFAEAQAVGFHKFFKLNSLLSLTNMILFDENGVIRRYNSVEDIFTAFYGVRLGLYSKRRLYLIGILAAQSCKLENQARLIIEKISGIIRFEDVKVADLIKVLIDRGYDSDPVKEWKKRNADSNPDEVTNEENENDDDDKDKPDYEYLTSMKLLDLSMEKKNKLLETRDAKIKELRDTEAKTPEQFWIEDLDVLEKMLDEMANVHSEPLPGGDSSKAKSAPVKKTKKNSKPIKTAAECAPSAHAIRIIPKLEEEYSKKIEKTKKEKNIKKQKDMMEDFFQAVTTENGDIDQNAADEGEAMPLAQRMVALGNATAKTMLKNNKKPAAGIKEINKPKRSISPSKKKKKELWESDSNDDGDVAMESGADDADLVVIPRDAGLKRNAAKNVVYTAQQDEDESIPMTPSDDDSGSFKISNLVKPKQSTLAGFIQLTSAEKPAKQKKLMPKDDTVPPTKKAKTEKPKVDKKLPKPKQTKEKEKKDKISKAPAKPKAKPAGKLERKPSITKKKSKDISSDEDADIFKADNAAELDGSDHDMVTSRARRQVGQKRYVVSDDESEPDQDRAGSDSDFDVVAEKKQQVKKKKNVFSDSE